MAHLFGHAFLFSGALASGAFLLNAGGAQAACPPILPAGSSIPWNGNIGTVGVSISDPSLPQCTFLSSQPNVVTFDSRWEVNANGGLVGPTSRVINYSLTTTTPGYWFSASLVDSDFDTLGAGGNTVQKQTFSSPDYSLASLIYDVTSLDGSNSNFQSIGGQFSTIYIRDTITLVGPDTFGTLPDLDNATNTFRQTLGPLPILGAGAAFGFSRKLRGRIKASRLG